MISTLLFVYGTLKRGQTNHRLIRNQKFVRKAGTLPKYRLYDLGPYPALVRDLENGLSVRGEIWDVAPDAFGELDKLEDVPAQYVREPIEVLGIDDVVEAYIYVRTISPDTRSGCEWPL